MTGRHEFKNGVTHTILERERLTPKATTLAQVLKTAGYTTGIFGKWHLGDEPDHWPSNRGFDEMFIHGCGGIGQTYPGSLRRRAWQYLLRPGDPTQRQVRQDHGLLHRRVLQPGDEVDRVGEDSGQAVLLLHPHERSARHLCKSVRRTRPATRTR